jgi:hypothetical protein
VSNALLALTVAQRLPYNTEQEPKDAGDTLILGLQWRNSSQSIHERYASIGCRALYLSSRIRLYKSGTLS